MVKDNLVWGIQKISLDEFWEKVSNKNFICDNVSCLECPFPTINTESERKCKLYSKDRDDMKRLMSDGYKKYMQNKLDKIW